MFVSPVSSSMVAPAFGVIRADFDIKTDVEIQLILSVFILASAIGPLVVSPLSEVYGRYSTLQFTCGFYFIFNLACGFSQTSRQLLIFRCVTSSLFPISKLGRKGLLITQIFEWDRWECIVYWRWPARRLLGTRRTWAVT
jgi:MFS family permease